MALGTSLVKYILFFFNVLCFIGGLILTGIGAVVYKNVQEYIVIYNHDGKTLTSVNPALAVIVFGVIILLISFLGCCGAIRENHSMLTCYSVILFIILALEIGLCAYSLNKVNSSDLKETIKKSFTITFDEYHKSKPIEKAWNLMQKNLKCCGIDSYKNWLENTNKSHVPKSCCITKSPNCADGITDQTTEKDAKLIIYTEGCEDKILELINDKRSAIAGIIIGFVQLIGIVFACCLAGRYRDKSYNPV